MANLVGILASGVTDVGGKVRWKHEAGVKALETVGRGSMFCRQGVGDAPEKHERFVWSHFFCLAIIFHVFLAALAESAVNWC